MQQVWVAVAAWAVACASACSGGGTAPADICDLAEMPAGTPAALQVLHDRAGAALAAHDGGEGVSGEHGGRVLAAAVTLQSSVATAQIAASDGSLGSLASEFFSGPLYPDVSKAQADLRTACGG